MKLELRRHNAAIAKHHTTLSDGVSDSWLEFLREKNKEKNVHSRKQRIDSLERMFQNADFGTSKKARVDCAINNRQQKMQK